MTAPFANSATVVIPSGLPNESLFLEVYGAGCSSGIITFFNDSLVITAPSVVTGCTDPTAQNYNPAATADDGSCLYSVTGGGVTPSPNCFNTITWAD